MDRVPIEEINKFRKHRERECPKCGFLYFNNKEYIDHIYEKHSY